MEQEFKVTPLTQERFDEAVQLVLDAELDTREEIEHHLQHIDAHLVALDKDKVVGVIGWYQDNVNYANEAMGNDFPGEEAYWVGFFAVDKKYRSKGIGKALLEKIEQVVKEKGADKFYVCSVGETQSYYEEHGFKLIKEGKINGRPEFFMVKQI